LGLRWTRKAIVAEIKRLHAEGAELNYATAEDHHLNLVRAAAWHFGTWRRAVESAGIEYESISKYQRWNRERIIARIRELHSEGADLNWRAVSTEIDPPLAAAALRSNGFQSWRDAIRASGLDINGVARYQAWDEERVVKDIKALHRAGMPLSSKAVQLGNQPLFCAARRRFGSWDEALAAAGLSVQDIRLRQASGVPYGAVQHGAAQNGAAQHSNSSRNEAAPVKPNNSGATKSTAAKGSATQKGALKGTSAKDPTVKSGAKGTTQKTQQPQTSKRPVAAKGVGAAKGAGKAISTTSLRTPAVSKTAATPRTAAQIASRPSSNKNATNATKGTPITQTDRNTKSQVAGKTAAAKGGTPKSQASKGSTGKGFATKGAAGKGVAKGGASKAAASKGATPASTRATATVTRASTAKKEAAKTVASKGAAKVAVKKAVKVATRRR
jgi:hypothetical protein